MPTKEEILEKRKKLRISVPIKKSNKKLRSSYIANLSKDRYYAASKNIKEIKKLTENEDSKELEAAKATVKAQSSKKKKVLSLVFFLINIVVIAIILIVQMKQGIVGSPSELDVNGWYILGAFGMFALIVLSETLKFNVLIRKATGRNRLGLSFKTAVLGRYYDVITPFATGGQPFQIYYTNKYGIKGGESFSITMSEHMFQQIAYFIIITVIFVGSCLKIGGITNIILKYSSISPVEAGIVASMSWVGYTIVAALLLAVAVIILNRKVGTAIVVGVLKLFCKIFRRDYNKLFRKTMRTVITWQSTMRRYKKSPWVWISNILLSTLFYAALYSIPYFIYCAFMGWNSEIWLKIILLTIIIDLAASFNPLPGGTGVSDLSFLAVFTSLFAVKNTFWALLLWKFFTYYGFILQGLLVLTYDYFIGNKRLEKNREKWCAPRYDKIKVKNSLY